MHWLDKTLVCMKTLICMKTLKTLVVIRELILPLLFSVFWFLNNVVAMLLLQQLHSSILSSLTRCFLVNPHFLVAIDCSVDGALFSWEDEYKKTTWVIVVALLKANYGTSLGTEPTTWVPISELVQQLSAAATASATLPHNIQCNVATYAIYI